MCSWITFFCPLCPQAMLSCLKHGSHFTFWAPRPGPPSYSATRLAQVSEWSLNLTLSMKNLPRGPLVYSLHASGDRGCLLVHWAQSSQMSIIEHSLICPLLQSVKIRRGARAHSGISALLLE